jgi:hypothetical protein
MKAIKARKIVDKSKVKKPLEEKGLIVFVKKIIDGIKLIVIYNKIRRIAHKKDNVLSVKKISPALKEKLEKNGFIVTYHRFHNCHYIRW